jgi:hypothetical protein
MRTSDVVVIGDPEVGRRGSWTASVALTRFVWAVQHGAVVGDGVRGSCSRAALAVWIRKLHIFSPRERDVPTSSSVDDVMLGWLVSSVRCGWTPCEVLIWVLPLFGELLFHMISDDNEGE